MIGKRRALLSSRLDRVAIIALLSCATLALASCGPHQTPSSSFVPLSLEAGPRAAHFTPFFSFGGGKETNVNGGGGGLIVDASGNFYGVAQGGGDPNCLAYYGGCGFVYELVKSGRTWTMKVLHVFLGPDGAAPKGTLIEVGGSFYGTTSVGGSNASCFGFGCGTVYQLTPTSSGYRLTTIHQFTGPDGANPDGAQLVADAQGNIFGTTQAGGGGFSQCPAGPVTVGGGCGAVYKLTPSRTGYAETTIFRFNGFNGQDPAQGLTIVNGNLFGTTKFTDTRNENCAMVPCGIVYELIERKNGSYRFVLVHKFKGGKNDGSTANAIIVGRNGVLYGETRVGGGGDCSEVPGGQGKEGCGVLYTLTPTNAGNYTFKVIYRFKKISDGIFPGFRMVLFKGLLYGTTGGGGYVNPAVHVCVNLDGCGVLFSVKPSGANYKVLYRFTGKADGAWPLPPLLAVNGSIYGTDLVAGQFGYGSAFRYTP